jgi:hypothetical protein
MKERVEGYFYISRSGRVYYVSVRGLRSTIYDIESHIAVELLSKKRLTVEDVGKIAMYMEVYDIEGLERRLGKGVEVLKVYRYEPRKERKKAEACKET